MPLKKLALAASIALLMLPLSAALAGPAAPDQKELESVLRRLDAASANFHSASADFTFDTEQLDPVPDTEIQKGSVFYERKSAAFRMAAHIREMNGRIVPKIYTYASKVFRLYEPLVDQVTTFSKAGKFESYLMLGFGASGKELAEKWDIKYLGSEPIDGVKTEKLEMVAKDPEVRKVLTKVTIWVDPDRAVSLKQRFDEGASTYRVCTYTHFKTNQSLPADSFTLKTDKKTQYINR